MTTLLEPFQPGRHGAWDFEAAAHLLERAGFGGTEQEVEKLASMPFQAAIERVLSPQDDYNSPVPSWVERWDRERRIDRSQLSKEARDDQDNLREQNMAQLQLHWIRQMGSPAFPLREKLALFWHGHFATSAEKVTDPLMMREQIELFRVRGMGSFPELVKAVCLNPAMIRFLDSESNVKGRPNENFAREVMELYTVGEGNYSEEDVLESARAFTGLGIRQFAGVLRKEQHDEGTKTVLGETGNWGPEDVVRILMRQPAMSRFITTKLFKYFVAYDPSPDLVREMAWHFKFHSFTIGSFLRVLFSSRLFFAPSVRRTLVKSPTQLIVGTLRKLPMSSPSDGVLLQSFRQMGQELLRPPDVNGWNEGPAWINTHALTIRYHFAHHLTTGEIPDSLRPGWGYAWRAPEGPNTPLIKPKDIGLPAHRMQDADAAVDKALRMLMGIRLSPARKTQYVTYLRTGANGARVLFDLSKDPSAERFLGVLYLMMSAPEYHMC